MEQKLKADSFYARGVYLDKMKASAMEERGDCAGKAVALIECLAEAGALTQTAAAVALRRNRQEMGAAAKGLWLAGVVDIYSVFSQNAHRHCQCAIPALGGQRLPASCRCRGCMPTGGPGTVLRPRQTGNARVRLAAGPPPRPAGAGGSQFRQQGRRSDQVAGRRSEDWVMILRRKRTYLFTRTAKTLNRKRQRGKRYTWDLAVVGARPDELRQRREAEKIVQEPC